ncbi:MAG: hypothetical protein KY476_08125 [Planctomycetes bacterium]|nr:hypothetical protein [Planctomycetota bacterium]
MLGFGWSDFLRGTLMTAFVFGAASSRAAEPNVPSGDADVPAIESSPGFMMSPPAAFFPEPASPFPHTPWADRPHTGGPEEPSVGHPHYDRSMERYGGWYRPKAFGLKAWQRCTQPLPWRPRGYGNLLARPFTCYRMDYDPYVLSHHETEYGPSYYLRKPDQMCRDHHPRTR